MTTIYDELVSERYHQPETTPQEDPMGLIATIEQDVMAAGHEVSDVLHGVLARHLTLANIAAHVANEAAALQDSTWVQLGEKYAGLPPAWIATAEHVLDTVAADLGTLTQAAAPTPADPAPAEPDVPADPGEPVPVLAGPVVGGQAQ